MNNRLFLTFSLAITAIGHSAEAGDATWKLNPTSGDWDTAANWTPEAVPNQPGDIATFDVSNVTTVSSSVGPSIGAILFNAGASPYRIIGDLGFFGAGVINNSGVTQNFESSDGFGFGASATAGMTLST